jgi:hypothetical protein
MEVLSELLKGDQFKALASALASPNEKEAKKRVSVFRKTMDGTSPIKAFQISTVLDKAQRDLIMEIMDL